MLPSADACDECLPAHLRRPPSTTASLFASFPFLLTFALIAILFQRRLFPLLSNTLQSAQQSASPLLRASLGPHSIPPPKAADHSAPSATSLDPIQRFSAAICASTVALAAVLAELVLCDVAGVLNLAFRAAALRLTVALLLLLLLVIIPALEIRTIVMATGGRYVRSARSAAVMQATGFGLWMLTFWWSGRLGSAERRKEGGGPISAGVEHVGVIGISLMALLSGFASVSASWQSFGARPGPVSDASVSRKRAGLESTTDMLAAKHSRLRALQRKADDQPATGFLSKALGAMRGQPDASERASLDMEISGLENMALALAADLSALQARQQQQLRAHTTIGRLYLAAARLFALYCAYRILATLLAFLHRHLFSPSSFSVFPSTATTSSSTTDPVSAVLALLPRRYVDQLPLDRAASARPIAFLFSGLVLAASISSALQTLRLGARYVPGVLRAARAALPLLVAQLGATYVLSAALLLRGMAPSAGSGRHAGAASTTAAGGGSGSGGSGQLMALGGRDMAWVDGWFEAWFLAGAVATALGIWIGGKVAAGVEWDDDGEVELGKRS